MANEKVNTNEVLMPVAMATFLQSGWFFGASFLRKYVSALPKDPLVMIGGVYALAGADILVYYYYKNRQAEKKVDI